MSVHNLYPVRSCLPPLFTFLTKLISASPGGPTGINCCIDDYSTLTSAAHRWTETFPGNRGRDFLSNFPGFSYPIPHWPCSELTCERRVFFYPIGRAVCLKLVLKPPSSETKTHGPFMALLFFHHITSPSQWWSWTFHPAGVPLVNTWALTCRYFRAVASVGITYHRSFGLWAKASPFHWLLSLNNYIRMYWQNPERARLHEKYFLASISSQICPY